MAVSPMVGVDKIQEPMESMEDEKEKIPTELPPMSSSVVGNLFECDDNVFSSLDNLMKDLNRMISDFDRFVFDAGDVDSTNIGSTLFIAEDQFKELVVDPKEATFSLPSDTNTKNFDSRMDTNPAQGYDEEESEALLVPINVMSSNNNDDQSKQPVVYYLTGELTQSVETSLIHGNLKKKDNQRKGTKELDVLMANYPEDVIPLKEMITAVEKHFLIRDTVLAEEFTNVVKLMTVGHFNGLATLNTSLETCGMKISELNALSLSLEEIKTELLELYTSTEAATRKYKSQEAEKTHCHEQQYSSLEEDNNQEFKLLSESMVKADDDFQWCVAKIVCKHMDKIQSKVDEHAFELMLLHQILAKYKF